MEAVGTTVTKDVEVEVAKLASVEIAETGD